MKNLLLFIFLFLVTLGYSQTDTSIVKKEIEGVIENFNMSEFAMTINLKHVLDSNKKIQRVYWKGEKLKAVSYPHEWAANGTRTVYFNENNEIQLIRDQANGTNWSKELFAFIANSKIYTFINNSSINYNNDGIAQSSANNAPISNQLVSLEIGVEKTEQLEDFNLNTIREHCFSAFKTAKSMNILEKGKYLFQGKIGFKVAFQMKWKLNKKGKINGEITYLSDKESNTIKGKLSEQRFSIIVTNDNNNAEGRIIGRIIDATTFRGQLFLDSAEKGDFFEMNIIQEK